MSSDAKTVSVVIPTYQRAATVGRAVASILAQTRPVNEVIVVDDASTDSTEQAVGVLEDRRVRYLRHPDNRGGAAARNTGIAAASGHWIAFQDSDDVWRPDKMQRQIASLDSAGPDTAVGYCRFVRHHERTTTLEPPGTPTSGHLSGRLAWGNLVSTQCAVVRRDVFDEIGDFDTRLTRYQDWDLFLRVSRKYAFDFVAEPLVDTYVSADSISMDPATLVDALDRLLTKHPDILLATRPLRARYHYLMGVWRCATGRTSAGRGHLLKSLAARPCRLRPLAPLLLSLAGSGVYRRFTGGRGPGDLRPVSRGGAR